MSIINDEMKGTADYAINASKERFKIELDFSEQSVAQLDIILERLYWGFYSQPKDRGEGGLVFQTAIIWGSYLGEYMRRKWGGTWMLNGKDRVLSIINIEFSPINLVYQKITTHPEYSVKNYLNETEKIINNTPVIYPQPQQHLAENVGQPAKKIPSKQTKKTKIKDKRLIYILASIGAILLVIVSCVGGYMLIRTSGVSAVGFPVSASITSTDTPIVATLETATSSPEITQIPTQTTLPTSTPIPTFTPLPSFTPSQTFTQIFTSTPTETSTPIIPRRTRTPSPTTGPGDRTNTPIPPTVPQNPTATKSPQTSATVPPQPTATKTPQPTATVAQPTATKTPQPTATVPQPTATTRPQPTITPVPVVIDSCDVNPSTVPIGQSVTITFIVHFSAPGYGFDAEVNNGFNGEGGCHGDDSGNGVAYCDGSSGELPAGASGIATLSSSVGDCVVGFSSR
jgi:hypothetical protein